MLRRLRIRDHKSERSRARISWERTMAFIDVAEIDDPQTTCAYVQ